MNTPVKLTLYGTVVAAVFAGALAVGAAAGPIDVGGEHDDDRRGGAPMTEAPDAGHDDDAGHEGR